MSEFHPPLRKVVERREDGAEVLECGHAQSAKKKRAKRRRCAACRRSTITIGEAREAAEGVRCPYCLDTFDDPEEPTTTCQRCRTKLHTECSEENEGCTTFGCKAGPSAAVVRIRATRARVEETRARVDAATAAPAVPVVASGAPVPSFNRWILQGLSRVFRTAVANPIITLMLISVLTSGWLFWTLWGVFIAVGLGRWIFVKTIDD